MKSINAKLKATIGHWRTSTKVVAICATSTFVATSIICVLFVYRDWQDFKLAKIATLSSLASVVANNTQAALRFEDRVAAREYLASLAYEADIRRAALFDSQNAPFASFPSDEAAASIPERSREGIEWSEGSIFVTVPIALGEARLGTLTIEAGTEAIRHSLRRSLLTSGLLLLTATVLSTFFAFRLQRFVTTPIKDLEQTAKEVRRSESYTARAIRKYNDDVGSLVESFNAMLDKIEQRDSSLREMNSKLESIVEQRTKDLRIQNLALQQAIEAANAASVAKTEFLATTSHELRTPLNPIIGYVEKIQREYPDNPHAHELGLIRQSAEQLLRLIEDILDFSRIERGTLRFTEETVDAQALTHAIAALLEPQASSKGLKLEHRYKNELSPGVALHVVTDEGRLRQVMLNLASNAIKFTHHGSVEIETTLKHGPEGKALLQVQVIDTGIGIAESDQQKLFKPFSQLDASWTREYGGMGLGLAICQRIVKALGGDIVCKSSPNKGSQFTASLPVQTVEPAAASQADSEDCDPFAQVAGAKVLLVEDEAVNRELMDALLSSLGHDVEIAHNGEEAVNMASAEAYDFILLDISMPKMDGFEASRRIRSKGGLNENTPIVAMTAHVTPEDKDGCIAAGMNDYLSKPVSFTKLKKSLSAWLEKRPA